MNNGTLASATVLVLVASSLLGFAAPALAHGGAHDLVVVASEDGCPDGRAFCFEITEGSLSDVGPGDEVTITLKNEGSSLHNLYVTRLSQADPGGDTPSEAAFAETEDLDRDEQGEISFTVPESAEGIYLWCEVSGHEQLGMYTEAPFQADVAPSSGDGAQATSNDSPVAWALVPLSLAGVAAALVLGRRDGS